jgi:hypothetical protein
MSFPLGPTLSAIVMIASVFATANLVGTWCKNAPLLSFGTNAVLAVALLLLGAVGIRLASNVCTYWIGEKLPFVHWVVLGLLWVIVIIISF